MDPTPTDTLKINFTHSNTARDRKAYTLYEIEVRTSSTMTWVIYKRYSDFYGFHQELVTLCQTLRTKDGVIETLPILPPKKMTRTLATEFVQKRKRELEEYLLAVLARPTLLYSKQAMDFLEVPESVRPMLASDQQTQKSMYTYDLQDLSTEARQRLLSQQANYEHKSLEERKVLELVNLLELNKSKVSAIKRFEQYFFEQKPRLSPDFIRLLFQGKSGGKGEGGIVQTCGDLQYSHVAARAALFLIVRLLDAELNKDARLFLDQFIVLSTEVLKRLQLHMHILSERGTRLAAFRIVALLQANNPDVQLDVLVGDTWARQEYCRWAQRSLEQGRAAKETPDPLQPPPLQDPGAKPLVQAMFQELLDVAKDRVGWHPVTPFVQVAAGDPSVSIHYKKHPAKDVVQLRLVAQLPCPAKKVVRLLADITRAAEWDVKLHEASALTSVDKATDVVHMVYKSHSSPYKYRDFCLLRAGTNLLNGGRLLACRSVLHPKCPERADCVRGLLGPSGYIVTPLEDKAGAGCLLTFYAQMDSTSVLIVSPELLGESNELHSSVGNLWRCLSSEQ